MDRLKQISERLVQGLSILPGVHFCGMMPKRRDDIRLPAILLTVAELEPGQDPGTGELALVAHWEARLVVSDHMAELDGWAMVQTVLYWLFDQRFPEANIGRAQIKQASPDHFSPDYLGHQVWLIEWTQTLRVGEDVWQGDGVIPTTLSVGGLSPERKDLEVAA